MSYRNIDVDGRRYQYVIGKTNVHIKSDGIKSINISKDQLGGFVWVDCGCDNGIDCLDGTNKRMVGPKSIATAIRRFAIPSIKSM